MPDRRLEELLRMKVVEKREQFHQEAVKRDIITPDQAEMLTLLYMEWLDNMVREDE